MLYDVGTSGHLHTYLVLIGNVVYWTDALDSVHDASSITATSITWFCFVSPLFLYPGNFSFSLAFFSRGKKRGQIVKG